MVTKPGLAANLAHLKRERTRLLGMKFGDFPQNLGQMVKDSWRNREDIDIEGRPIGLPDYSPHELETIVNPFATQVANTAQTYEIGLHTVGHNSNEPYNPRLVRVAMETPVTRREINRVNGFLKSVMNMCIFNPETGAPNLALFFDTDIYRDIDWRCTHPELKVLVEESKESSSVQRSTNKWKKCGTRGWYFLSNEGMPEQEKFELIAAEKVPETKREKKYYKIIGSQLGTCPIARHALDLLEEQRRDVADMYLVQQGHLRKPLDKFHSIKEKADAFMKLARYDMQARKTISAVLDRLNAEAPTVGVWFTNRYYSMLVGMHRELFHRTGQDYMDLVVPHRMNTLAKK